MIRLYSFDKSLNYFSIASFESEVYQEKTASDKQFTLNYLEHGQLFGLFKPLSYLVFSR